MVKIADMCGLDPPPLTEDSEEVYEKVNAMHSTAALMGALILSFTFSLDSVSLDLGEGFPDPVCPGWLGYKGRGIDLQFEDDCQSCVNVWRSCANSGTMIRVYSCMMMLSCMAAGLGVSMAVGIMNNFATIPKSNAKLYATKLGWRLTVARSLVNVSLGFFFLGAMAKFSLVLDQHYFLGSVFVLMLLMIIYCAADQQGRALLGEFLKPMEEEEEEDEEEDEEDVRLM